MASKLHKKLKQQVILSTIRLDQDLIEVAKQKAEEEGIGYLTWLNKKLRQAVLNERSSSEELKERVEKLEKAVFKKKAI